MSKKIASPAYIAGEYFIFTAIFAWVLAMIVGFSIRLIGELFDVLNPESSTFFYTSFVLLPFVYWFAVKYSALNIGKGYLISDPKKTAHFAIGYKIALFLGLIIYQLVNLSSKLELGRKISEALQLGNPYIYNVLTFISSIISVLIFCVATKKYIRSEKV